MKKFFKTSIVAAIFCFCQSRGQAAPQIPSNNLLLRFKVLVHDFKKIHQAHVCNYGAKSIIQSLDWYTLKRQCKIDDPLWKDLKAGFRSKTCCINLVDQLAQKYVFEASEKKEISENLCENRMRSIVSFMALVYQRILFIWTHLPLYDIALFYLQLSALPLSQVFDLISTMHGHLQHIINAQLAGSASFSDWLTKQWWVLPATLIFFVVSYLRWRGAHQSV